MAYNFKECNREQIYLLPPTLQEWLPSTDLVWLLLDAVGEMDLRAFYEKYREDGKGQSAFEPSMMVSSSYMHTAWASGRRARSKSCASGISGLRLLPPTRCRTTAPSIVSGKTTVQRWKVCSSKCSGFARKRVSLESAWLPWTAADKEQCGPGSQPHL